MATYYSSYANQYRLRLDVTQGTQNTTNNTSVVSWTLYLTSGWNSISAYSTYSATVNGVTSPSTTQTNVTIGPNSSVTLGSGSTTVTHNADGTKSVPFSASFKTNSNIYYQGALVSPGSTMTISGSFPLTTIPRYAGLTAFTVSINDLSATASWTADKTISQWRLSWDSGSTYPSGWMTANSKSGSTGFGVSPGSTYGVRIQVKNSESGLITTSSVVSKTATKTPSTLTLSTTSQNVGSGITWTINESYDYTHQITYTFGSTSGYILGSNGVTSNTSTATWTVPTALANQIPSATSGSGTIYLYTYYGGVHIGTKSYTFTAKVPNNTTWQPTIPSVTISHVGNRPTGSTSYVQGRSQAKVVSSSTAQGGAAISSYRVSVSSIGTYYGSNITSGYLTNSGTVTITVRATDSRGYYREKSDTISVTAYSPPKLSGYTAQRSPNDQGTNLATNINFSVSPIDNQNTKLYRIRYRETNGTWVTLVNSGEYYTRNTTHSATGVLDVNKSYEVEFYVADWYTSVTQTRNIGTAFTLMDFNESGRGIAIGKVSQSDSFEVAIPMTIDGNTVWHAGNDESLFYENDNSISSTENSSSWKNGIRFMRVGVAGLGYPTHGIVESVKRQAYASQILAGNDREIYFRTTNPSTGMFHNWVRLWTSYNSNTIIGYGSNSNGRYVMFSDGTQICYFTVSCSYHTSIQLRGTWTFPASFIVNPTVVAAKDYSVAAPRLANSSPHVASKTTTHATIDLVQIVTTSGNALVESWLSGDVYGASCIAIGRWN